MIPEAMKKKWVEALRSGKYVQGRQHLKAPNEEGGFCHCCLGVACEVLREELKLKEVEEDNEDPWFPVSFERYTDSVQPWKVWMTHRLSTGVRKDLGITRAREQTLINLNDRGESFEKIADYIEENL